MVFGTISGEYLKIAYVPRCPPDNTNTKHLHITLFVIRTVVT